MVGQLGDREDVDEVEEQLEEGRAILALLRVRMIESSGTIGLVLVMPRA